MPRPRHRLLLDLLPPVTLLAVGTALFRLTDLDLAWTIPWSGEGDWPQGDTFPWGPLYHLGTLPAVILVTGAVLVLLAGLRSARWARWRRHAAYLILLLAMAPGLVTNALLKDHWGRPRPRDVTDLGGSFPFEPLLTVDPDSPGKSFPCGHATMGFFFIAGYFLLRRRHPAWAGGMLATGLAFGLALGWARVAQGGHFPSDILWAGGIVWITAAVLAHLLRVEEPPTPPQNFRPLPWPALLGATLLLPALLFLALLASPVGREVPPLPPDAGPVPGQLRLRVPTGTTRLLPGDRLAAAGTSTGHGLPGGGIKSDWRPVRSDDGLEGWELKQRVSGLNTELGQRLNVTWPRGLQRIKVRQEAGIVEIHLPDADEPGPRLAWELTLGAAQLVVEDGGEGYTLTVNGQPQPTPNPGPHDIEVSRGR